MEGFVENGVPSWPGDSATGVVPADFDGDGDPDILAVRNRGDDIAWYENVGGGQFLRNLVDASAPDMYSAIPVDIDQDGDLDIVAYGTSGTVFYLYENLSKQLGDYNRDGQVDAADYTVWRNTLGAGGLMPYAGADGSGNGMVGPEDYLVWKAHYGQSLPLPGGGGLTEVSAPETVAYEVVLDADVVVASRVDAMSVAEANDVPFEIATGSGDLTLARESRRPVGSRLVGAGNSNVVARDDALAVWVTANEQRATDRRLAEGWWETREASEDDGEGETAEGIDALFEMVGCGDCT
jgi:hypothetical protein